MLCVFSRQTIVALRTNDQLKIKKDFQEYLDTAQFLEIVCDWFSIVNNNQVGGITNDRIEFNVLVILWNPVCSKGAFFGQN